MQSILSNASKVMWKKYWSIRNWSWYGWYIANFCDFCYLLWLDLGIDLDSGRRLGVAESSRSRPRQPRGISRMTDGTFPHLTWSWHLLSFSTAHRTLGHSADATFFWMLTSDARIILPSSDTWPNRTVFPFASLGARTVIFRSSKSYACPYHLCAFVASFHHFSSRKKFFRRSF